MPRSVAEHQASVEALLRSRFTSASSTVEKIPLAQARGRVLAADVHAPTDLPPFANSQMDGYAVHSADLQEPSVAATTVRLHVAGPIAAGYAAVALPRGTAAPIMTGAMLPEGADTVIAIERADPPAFFPDVESPTEREVAVPVNVPAGEYVRAAGSDITRGTLALPAGTGLGPAQLGLLAALGIAEAEVLRRPRALLLSTGDEVIEPGRPLGPGQIYDANSTMLRAALEEAGVDVRELRVRDEPERFLRQLEANVQDGRPDFILSSGGISKGSFEVARLALEEHDVEFLSVAVQPGGPQGIGTVMGLPYLGFPGNPVSSLVSFELFLRPALGAVLGFPPPRRELTVPLAEALTSPAGKHQVRRGRYGGGTVALIGGAGSHLVHALAESNALVHIPADVTELLAGDEVRVWLV